ncbi:MAG: TRAP transporter small permease [Treponema sp.]|jgi:TRAP-type C4-dicarboxylate transport system permease small subunit|nr:TRAP transporter small permease [Treponema sp.]
MGKIYKKLCEIEMWAAILCLICSVTVIFIAAILRTVKMPIRWGLDIALLLFTWSTFLGADIAFRKKCLVRVDMLINRLPVKIQKALEAAVYLCMLSAIVFMLAYGIKLTVISRARVFNGIPGLSYSWVTASVPFSMWLMLITALTQIYETYFRPKQKEAGPC